MDILVKSCVAFRSATVSSLLATVCRWYRFFSDIRRGLTVEAFMTPGPPYFRISAGMLPTPGD